MTGNQVKAHGNCEFFGKKYSGIIWLYKKGSQWKDEVELKQNHKLIKRGEIHWKRIPAWEQKLRKMVK